MYKAFCKINTDMPYMRFKRILDEFNKVVKEDVLDRSQSFKMPYGLGTICIVKYKPKSMQISRYQQTINLVKKKVKRYII